MKYYDTMGFESEHGVYVRRVDHAEAIAALTAERDALSAQYRRDIRDWGQTVNALTLKLAGAEAERDHVQEILDSKGLVSMIDNIASAKALLTRFVSAWEPDGDGSDKRLWLEAQAFLAPPPSSEAGT